MCTNNLSPLWLKSLLWLVSRTIWVQEAHKHLAEADKVRVDKFCFFLFFSGLENCVIKVTCDQQVCSKEGKLRPKITPNWSAQLWFTSRTNTRPCWQGHAEVYWFITQQDSFSSRVWSKRQVVSRGLEMKTRSSIRVVCQRRLSNGGSGWSGTAYFLPLMSERTRSMLITANYAKFWLIIGESGDDSWKLNRADEEPNARGRRFRTWPLEVRTPATGIGLGFCYSSPFRAKSRESLYAKCLQSLSGDGEGSSSGLSYPT